MSLVFPGKTRAEQREVKALKDAGAIRSVGPRLYVRRDVTDPARLLRENWARIVATLYPGALISHRTALEYKPTSDGDVFLTGRTRRSVEYPGLRLRFDRGPEPLDDDVRFVGARASSLPRALLENLSTSRGVPKNLPREALERRLEQVLRDAGEHGLNELRDRARQIAKPFGWELELERLDELIGALLGTRSDATITSDLARARIAGSPFDEACLRRLELLLAELRVRRLVPVEDRRGYGDHFAHKAFFEAYFSNYIEGTDFELDEAERIVFDRVIPPQRPKDAHDIASTFRIVADPNEMRRVPREPSELVSLLRDRHAVLMKERPEVEPGQFKQTINRAGDTVFVHPDYVVGTLQRGAELLAELETGLERAVFVMFLVADVHPFLDGNGRIARIMMNAELVATRSATIIIPTNYRDEYIDTLRALTRRDRAKPVVDMLVKAQRFSSLDFTSYPAIRKELEDRNWFKEPTSTFKLVL